MYLHTRDVNETETVTVTRPTLWLTVRDGTESRDQDVFQDIRYTYKQMCFEAVTSLVNALITARRVCIARTLLWKDVCPSMRPSVTRRYSV